jgi:hypothetical protein
VAQQVSNTAPRQKSVSVKNLPPHAVAPATAHAEASSGGSLIVSIQGGATDSMSCAEATKTTPRVADAANLDPSKKNQTAQGQSTKPAQNGCGPIASHDAESHPSVVNLTAGK